MEGYRHFLVNKFVDNVFIYSCLTIVKSNNHTQKNRSRGGLRITNAHNQQFLGFLD
jgi:hypothetical protein